MGVPGAEFPRVPPTPPPHPLIRRGRAFVPTFRYWMETEVHVYAFSIAANVLLSFFPFLIVMLSLCRYVFRWPAAEKAIFLALNDYFPEPFGGFLQRNLVATVESRGPLQVASILLLLFTANGIFEPLEVALNRVWGITPNRSFWKNQLVSLALIFACGGLILFSTTITAVNQEFLADFKGHGAAIVAILGSLGFRVAAIPMIMVMLFLIYWLLPNGKVPARSVLPVAILVGLVLEVLKYINLATWPWLRLKLAKEYGPFLYSVTIILWSFLAALVILAGAEWTARGREEGGTDMRSHSC